MRLIGPARLAVRAGAVVALGAALAPPLHEAAERSFAAHMVQHELLVLVAAPLVAAGWVTAPVLDVLPARVRRLALTARRVRAVWRRATSPLAAWLLHAVTIWAWHAPALFDATLAHPLVHALEHATFTATAVAFWWSLLRPGRAGHGVAMLSAFTTAVHTGALGALLTFAPAAVYGYGTTVAALEDQQLAGLIMWVPAGAVFVVAGVALGAAWLGEAERRGARVDPLVMARDA